MQNSNQEQKTVLTEDKQLNQKMHNEICSLRKRQREYKDLSEAEVMEKLNEINQEYTHLEEIEEIQNNKNNDILNEELENKPKEENSNNNLQEIKSEEPEINSFDKNILKAKEIKNNNNQQNQSFISNEDNDIKVEKKISYNKYEFYVSKDGNETNKLVIYIPIRLILSKFFRFSLNHFNLYNY